MRNNPTLFLVTLLVVVFKFSTVLGQSETGHFRYDLISYEIIDSQAVRGNINKIITSLKDQFIADVYFNKSWLVVIKKRQGGISKSMYNRKSRVLYEFFDGPKKKTLRIDSIYAYYKQDPKLSAAKDTLQEFMGIVVAQDEVSTIKGFECHKQFLYQGFKEVTVDETCVTHFIRVPNLICHGHLYFLNEGIPVEIVQDFVDFKITWGIVERLPISRKDKIFTMDLSGYSLSTVDIRTLIYTGIQFFRTHEPNSHND